ncbi:MAG: hypothetical protein FWF44_08015, partial [Defluviitaleaceae bacterium]|nr:hypothetical protein [Defluviitaleaceae bacterium]
MKSLSRFLVLVMLIEAVLPFSAPQKVRAAADPLTVSFQMSLTPGVNNPAPVYNANQPSPAGDRVFLAWPMDRIDGSSYTNGAYNLIYPLGAGSLARLTVVKTGGSTAVVTFNVETWDDLAAAYVRRSDLAATYRVHTNVGAAGGANFVAADAYISNYNGGDPDYSVTGAVSPSFNIKTGYGFSFQYYNITAHFLWNASDNQLYFVTDHVSPGNIVDFSLQFAALGGLAPIVFEKKILTGVSPDRFGSVPFANNRNTAPGSFAMDPDLGPGGYLDMVTPADTHPGSPDNELEIRFDIPKIYADDGLNNIHDFIPVGPSFGA